MSGREWKPGDVAMVKFAWGMGDYLPCLRASRHGKPGWLHDRLEGFTADDHPAGPTDVRPLVVIDPEDREQVERFARAYEATWTKTGSAESTVDIIVRQMQAALRSLLAPPKPAEPTGLGAVVEDAGGKRWTRYDERDPQPWWRTSTGDPDEPIECRFAYADIHAVRVLSDGVTA